MAKTKRKKVKRKKRKTKGKGLSEKEKKNIEDALIKNSRSVYFSKKIDELPEDIIEKIHSDVKIEILNNFHKKYFIDLIKEICINRIYLFFKTMKELNNIFLHTNLKRDIETYILIHSNSRQFSISQFKRNCNNFKKEKKNTFIPLFNKFEKEVEPKISKNSEQEKNYSASPSNEDKEFKIILNIFTLKELKLIFLLFQDYVVYNEFPLINQRSSIAQWINHKFPMEDYQRVLNS